MSGNPRLPSARKAEILLQPSVLTKASSSIPAASLPHYKCLFTLSTLIRFCPKILSVRVERWLSPRSSVLPFSVPQQSSSSASLNFPLQLLLSPIHPDTVGQSSGRHHFLFQNLSQRKRKGQRVLSHREGLRLSLFFLKNLIMVKNII